VVKFAVRHSPFATRQSPFAAVFGSAGASPSQISLLKPLLSLRVPDSTKQTMLRTSELSPNEFGAQKFRHQPLAKASGMNV